MPGGVPLRQFVICSLMCFGCASSTEMGWPGASTLTERGEPSPRSPALEPRSRWSDFGILGRLVVASDHPYPSLGHEPPSLVIDQVLTSPDTREMYRLQVASTRYPVGTWLVARHRTADGARTGPLYAQFRSSSGWRFVAATADGWLLDADLEACRTCHAQAPADFVFGPPRPLDSGLPRPVDGGLSDGAN